MVLFYLPHDTIRKVGFTATKKIGNAVKRNRAKRRLRAQFVQHTFNLQNGTYIFVAKTVTPNVEHSQLTGDFLKLIKQAKAFRA